MSAEALEDRSPLLDAYASRLGLPAASSPPDGRPGRDELMSSDDVRPAAALVAEAIDGLGFEGLQVRRRAVERLVADDGITYGGSYPGRPAGAWRLDPLPWVIESAEWSALEAGLEQRGRLLDALLVDLIGPRRILAEGLVPPEVVAGHSGFILPAHGIVLPSPRKLPMLAVDLARDADGSWVVLADRTQAPSGAGYAMANRRITARALEPVHRRAPLRRLRGWFDIVQAALLEAAPQVDDVPRVVVLTPGSGSETAYDQGLLATLLGHPLVESDDLVMRGGRLWMRTTERLQAVDVVFRRVDAPWCDSLDLLPQSRLGVPGLVAAGRRGSVSIVNPLRAGILENPGLMPVMDRLVRSMLGEDLLLPTPVTWWCGDDASRRHVLARLDSLVMRPLDRSSGPFPGWQLAAEERNELAARINAEPWHWTAQEPVITSTAPVVTPHGLEPRNVVLRTFGVALGEDYHFLPGGLARVATDPAAFVVTNHGGAASKDVWVLEAEGAATPPRVQPEVLARARLVVEAAQVPGPTPRAAEDLYWMGRYAERAEGGARLLREVDNLVEDHLRRPGTPGHAAMRAMLRAVTEVTGARRGFTGPGAEDRLTEPVPHLTELLVNPATPGSVAYATARASRAGGNVRELLSQDTWAVLSRLDRTLQSAGARGGDVPIQAVASQVVESLLALAGLSAESLVRDPIWAFTDAGRRVERAQQLVRLLRRTLAVPAPPVAEAQVVEAVLRVGDSVITYRRRMAAGVGPSRPATAACALLLTDPANPRSVLFQLERLRDDHAHAPDPRVAAEVRGVLAEVRALEVEGLTEGDRTGFAEALDDLQRRLRSLNDTLSESYFRSQEPQSSFVVAELVGSGR